MLDRVEKSPFLVVNGNGPALMNADNVPVSQVLDYEKTDGVAERVRGGRKGGKVDKHNIPSASPLSFSLAPRVFNGFIP